MREENHLFGGLPLDINLGVLFFHKSFLSPSSNLRTFFSVTVQASLLNCLYITLYPYNYLDIIPISLIREQNLI